MRYIRGTWLVLCLAVGGLFVGEVFAVLSQRQWVKVQGQSVEHTIHATSSRKATRARMREVPVYQLEAEVRYQYEGQEFVHTFGPDGFTSRSAAELEHFARELKRLPIVFVNPNTPSQASLQRRGLSLIFIYGLLIFLLVASYFALMRDTR